MEKLKKRLSVILVFAILTSVILVVSVVFTPLSAGWHKPVLMGFCIAGVVIGFYGSPMLWVAYGNMRPLLRILNGVENEGIRRVSVLAQYLGYSVEELKKRLTYLISHGYLPGFIVKEDELSPIDERYAEKVTTTMNCPTCGAPNTFEGKTGKCEYCGSILKAPKNK